MSNKPVLCIQVNEETQLRLLEERHVEDYFALIERNQEHLHAWVAVEAYEGSVETLRAYLKQRLLQFVNGEGYHLGIWYQDALVGILDYRLNGRSRSVELGYWLDAAMQGKGLRELSDKESIAYCLYLSGILALGEGDMASAHSRVEQAVALFQEMRQSHGTTISLHALAKVATAQEDYALSQALYEESIAMARKAGDKRNVTFGLEGLASAVAGQGKCAWAVRLWGAAEAVREAIGAPLPSVECASYNRAVAAARAYLGEQAFAAAWSQGREMTPEQALAKAN